MRLAVNCSVPPALIVAGDGLTLIAVATGAVNVSKVEPLIDPTVALIVVVPSATSVASPSLTTVATPGFEELQVTELVKFCVLPSLSKPVAVNCWLTAFGMDSFAGVIDMETSAAVTVTDEQLEGPPDTEAHTLVVPALIPVTNPGDVVEFTVATFVLVELQLAWLVTFWPDPSLNISVALSCWLVCAGILGEGGVTLTETGVATTSVEEPRDAL
jgi:hypothetical protein